MGEEKTKKPFTIVEIIGILILIAVIYIVIIYGAKLIGAIVEYKTEEELKKTAFVYATDNDIKIISSMTDLNGVIYTIEAQKDIEEIIFSIKLLDEEGTVLEAKTENYSNLVRGCSYTYEFNFSNKYLLFADNTETIIKVRNSR